MRGRHFTAIYGLEAGRFALVDREFAGDLEVTTSRLAMVRFHGRNAETWQKKGLAPAAERFNYLYSDEELEELRRR